MLNRDFWIRRWQRLVFSDRFSFFDMPARTLLRVCSVFYGCAALLRNKAYDKGVFFIGKAGVPVISVGNLNLGGTGKTSLVLWFAQTLRQSGKMPVILSRGYGRVRAKGKTLIVSDGKNVLETPETAGDEPYMLARKLKNVPVIVGPDRYKSALLAVEKFKPGCIILDDGFQHRRLQRDLDIVSLDESVLRAPHMFPLGVLRESASSLGRADIVVVKAETTAAGRFADSFRKVFSVGLKEPRAIFSYAAKGVSGGANEDIFPLAWLKDRKVTAFSGIARPESFENLLKKAGANVISSCRFSDHHVYSAIDLEKMRKDAEENGAVLVTTEKDAVKLPEKFPAYSLNIDLVWLEGEESLKKALLGVFAHDRGRG